MPFASIGRRRWCMMVVASVGSAVVATRRTMADSGAVAPIRTLCDALISIMKAGHSAPFQQRFNTLAPVVDRVFDLPVVLQVSVGPTWSSLGSDQQSTLEVAFRRYTLANYVSNFDNFTGQHFEVEPDTKSLPNGEQLAQTKIISASGETHELDYVMRNVGGAWKAVDVLADGSISRVAVQRSDFRRLVARGGAQALIESLNQKTNDLSGGTLT
ncbi:MAG TPA: ABC transporter substrate-binding protein [Acetobacteraceae bacterium]|jgi:phospholipid transport system substrate-binding protein|nr:ABC transporter substrate-binding protein [Acetobacteraceae bacterium]